MIRILCLCAFALISTNAFACVSAFDKALMYYGGKPPKGHQTEGPLCDDTSGRDPQNFFRDFHNDVEESRKKSEEDWKQYSRDMDARMQAEREYQQRKRLAADEDRRQSLIQGQLNQLNMNTIPRY